MDNRKFIITLICVGIAGLLYFKHIDGGSTFLAFLAGSPLAAEAGRKLLTAPGAAAPADPQADADASTNGRSANG